MVTLTGPKKSLPLGYSALELIVCSVLVNFVFASSLYAQPSAQEKRLTQLYSESVVPITIGLHSGDPGNIENQWSGLAFVVSEDGYLLTSAHLVPPRDVCDTYGQTEDERGCGVNEFKRSLDYRYSINGEVRGESIPIHLIYSDTQTDIALLKVFETNLSDQIRFKPVLLGDSDDSEIGEKVTALVVSEEELNRGTIFPTSGKIKHRNVYRGLWETDLAVNPGVSGAPVFSDLDHQPRVVAIATGGKRGISVEEVNFITPINFARPLLTIPGVHVHERVEKVERTVRRIQSAVMWDVSYEDTTNNLEDTVIEDKNLVFTYQRITDEFTGGSEIEISIVPNMEIKDVVTEKHNTTYMLGYNIDVSKNLEDKLSKDRYGTLVIRNVIESTVRNLCERITVFGDESEVLGWKDLRVVIKAKLKLSQKGNIVQKEGKKGDSRRRLNVEKGGPESTSEKLLVTHLDISLEKGQFYGHYHNICPPSSS